MWRHRDYWEPCPRLALPVPTEPDLSLQAATRLLRRALPLVGPCCCHHCPSPSGHGFQEHILRVLPRDGGDRAAHGGPELPFGRGMWPLPLARFQGPAAVTRTFQRGVGLAPQHPLVPYMPSCLKCSLIQVQKLFPGSWQEGNVDCSCTCVRVLLLLLPLALKGLCPQQCVPSSFSCPPAAGEVLLHVLWSGQRWESLFQRVVPSSAPPHAFPALQATATLP